MYCILINSSRKHYQEFNKFLLENKNDTLIDILSYADVNDINWESLSKYSYVIVLHRYSYINISKTIEFCNNKQPNLAALSAYWGAGFPYVCILSQSAISQIVSSLSTYGKYFEDNMENLLFNIFMTVCKLPSIRSVLFLSEQELQEYYLQNNVILLDNFAYLNNIDYISGNFHDALFVSFNDEDDQFMNFINEYHSGQKHIIFQNRHHVLAIGKQFFIIKQHHICLLDYQTMVYWDRNSSSWKLVGSDLRKDIEPHLQKFLIRSLDQKPSSRYYTHIRSKSHDQAIQEQSANRNTQF